MKKLHILLSRHSEKNSRIKEHMGEIFKDKFDVEVKVMWRLVFFFYLEP